MVITENRKPAWFFYPGWVVASAISIPIAWFVSMEVLALITSLVGGSIDLFGQIHITEDYFLGFILMPALGLISGLLQYLLLRFYLPRMEWWTAATAAGWVLPLLGFDLIALSSTVVDTTSVWAIGLFVVAFGACVGVGQWLVLRRRVRHASFWILASVLGWGIAFLPSGGSISSEVDILAVVLIPPIVASLAWWVLLGGGLGNHSTQRASINTDEHRYPD